MQSKASIARAAGAILLGGGVAGALDLLYAIVVYSPKAPILIPQTIASGVLGARSYSGGDATAALGVILQFVIALGAATVYYAASRPFAFLSQRPVAYGLFFGACVYVVMHGFVLPLSNVSHHAIPRIYVITEFVEHWFFVGLPIALATSLFDRAPRRASMPHAPP